MTSLPQKLVTKKINLSLILLCTLFYQPIYAQDRVNDSEGFYSSSPFDSSAEAAEADPKGEMMMQEETEPSNDRADSSATTKSDTLRSIDQLLNNLDGDELTSSAGNAVDAAFKSAQIKVLEKFSGKATTLTINKVDPVIFNGQIELKLIKCWQDGNGALINKYTALVELRDYSSHNPQAFEKHWLFNHNVELNTFSTERYFLFLNKCL